ncbi:MAG: M23 family metallopeptidase [Marinilabiliales bacterium]
MNKSKQNKKSSRNKRYILTLFRESDYTPIWKKNFHKNSFYSAVTGFIVLIIAITTIVFAYTPLKELLPGFPKENIVNMAKLNALKIDSLEQQIIIKDQYFDNLRRIINGEPPPGFQDTFKNETITDNFTPVENIKIPEDSILRTQVKQDENQFILTNKKNNPRSNIIKLVPPIHGLITGHFNYTKKHYGIDIVSQENEPITAVMDGTVILVSWTLEAGYVIVIQHDFNMISVYKHISKVNIKQGEKVNAGEIIGIIGNSGEYSSGPHLHFELWQDSKPLDPETLIKF